MFLQQGWDLNLEGLSPESGLLYQFSIAVVINDHNFGSLKQHSFITSQLHAWVRTPCRAWLHWVLCSRSHKTEIKASSGLSTYLEALWKNPPHSGVSYIQFHVVVEQRSPWLCQLSVRDHLCFERLPGFLLSLPCTLTPTMRR